MSSLAPCVSCQRHVRVTEPACPFCGAALPEDFAGRAVPGTTARLSRAALVAFATLGAAAGCGSSQQPAPASPPASPPVATTDDASAQPADASAQGPGAMVALYGAAPPPQDPGSPAVRYGGAPRP